MISLTGDGCLDPAFVNPDRLVECLNKKMEMRLINPASKMRRFVEVACAIAQLFRQLLAIGCCFPADLTYVCPLTEDAIAGDNRRVFIPKGSYGKHSAHKSTQHGAFQKGI